METQHPRPPACQPPSEPSTSAPRSRHSTKLRMVLRARTGLVQSLRNKVAKTSTSVSAAEVEPAMGRQRAFSFTKSPNFTRQQLWRWRTMRNSLYIQMLRAKVASAQLEIDQEEAEEECKTKEHSEPDVQQSSPSLQSPPTDIKQQGTLPRPFSVLRLMAAKSVAKTLKKNLIQGMQQSKDKIAAEVQSDIDDVRAMAELVMSATAANKSTDAETVPARSRRGSISSFGRRQRRRSSGVKFSTFFESADAGASEQDADKVLALCADGPASPLSPATQRYLPGIGTKMVRTKNLHVVRIATPEPPEPDLKTAAVKRTKKGRPPFSSKVGYLL